MRRIGFLTEMNRIESDRNGLNRADWIESETTKLDWLDWIGPNALYGPIELKQIFGLYRPCLEAIKSYVWNYWNLNTSLTTNCWLEDVIGRLDQKVNECSQGPLIGPKGSKLGMGGPEGSIYPLLRVRPWLKTFEVQKEIFKAGSKLVRKFKSIDSVLLKVMGRQY